ncbi:MAG TPA: Rrf2 family transcriptional regulator [Opitutaceae bacterium]|nr:Rrf2 family transcriptional regulator [Opitutaceae bacterium]
MISIGRHTDYAARLILHLAALGDDVQVTIREVAAERLLPMPFVRRLISQLTKAKILTAVRGAGGGIRLARPAAEISLLDIVDAMEGGVSLNRCVHDAKACPLAGNCPIHCVWGDVNRQLKENLSAVRFDALARTPKHMTAHLKLHTSAAQRPARRK